MRFSIRFLGVLSVSACAAFLQTDETLRIDSPAAGETLSGMVEVRGTAAEPEMMRFTIEFGYDPDPAGTWIILFEGTEPVRSGLLGRWDTSSVGEGDYALRLAAYFADGSVRETITGGLRVKREAPPATASVIEWADSTASDPGVHARAAAAFPAATAVFASEPSAAGDAASGRMVPLITGAGLAAAGFGVYWIRSRWIWWRRRMELRKLRKSGGKS